MKTLQQKIEVMQAALRGELIEWICPTDSTDAWTHCTNANHDNYTWNWAMFDYRVAQPKIAPGHNPHNLTNEQVETNLGWRLLYTDEIKSRKQIYREIEAWIHNKKLWGADEYEGNCAENTYRTKLTREQLAALDNPPKPKKRLPLGPEDFPPGTVIRERGLENTYRQINCVSNTSYWAFPWKESQNFDSATLMKDFERSLDGGKTWLPCYREE